MTSLSDWAYEHAWPKVLGDRVSQVLWVLDHQRDIDADFLAIYGIDLEQADVTGPRYFALAYRLTAYQGVMAALADEEREDQPSSTPTRTQAAPTGAAPSETSTEVSLTQFRAKFPGLVSVAQGG